MKLRRGSLQLVVLLLTLATNEPWGVAQPVPPTPVPPPVAPPGSPPPGTSPMLIAPMGGTATTQDIYAAASKGKTFLSVLVTDGNAPLLGFKNRAEASSVELGAPLPLYWVDLLVLRGYDPARSKVTETVRPMTSVIFPLQTRRQEDEGGKLKTRSAVVVSIRIDKRDKTKTIWKPVNWGLRPLAEDMTKYRETVSGFSSGIVVWIPSLNLHFLGDKFTEDLMLVPLADRPAYGLTKGVPISAKIVLALYAREARSIGEDGPG